MTLQPSARCAEYEEAAVPGQPDRLITAELSQKRVRAYLAGELVADTSAPLLVWENRNYPAYYIPEADIQAA
jgi:uncharacterized protein (DUF427 family)